MSDKHTNSNSKLPDRLYGEYYPDSFLDVPGPIRESSVATLGDYIRHLREIDDQRNQPCVACVAPESSFQHICPNNPILTCNCANPNDCPELGADPDGNGNETGSKDGNQGGNEDRCPDHDGFSDNLEYTNIEGIPIHRSTLKHSPWPCVVVGAVCEAWTNPAESIPDNTIYTDSTDRHGDAGQCAGPYVSTNH